MLVLHPIRAYRVDDLPQRKSCVSEIYHSLIARFCKRIDAVPCASGRVGLQLAVLTPLWLPGA